MTLSAELKALLREWHTGLDRSGAESHLFALDWRDSTTPFGKGRAYSPTVERLGAQLARAIPKARSVNVRLATGADGQDDVRIEVEREKQTTVDRWRPDKGLSEVRVAGAAPRTHDTKRLARARKIGLERARLEDTSELIAALKDYRNRLQDMFEAGANVGAELAAVNTERANVRVVHDRLNIERKLSKISDDLERLNEKLAEVPDSDLERVRDVLLEQQTRLEAARGR